MREDGRLALGTKRDLRSDYRMMAAPLPGAGFRMTSLGNWHESVVRSLLKSWNRVWEESVDSASFTAPSPNGNRLHSGCRAPLSRTFRQRTACSFSTFLGRFGAEEQFPGSSHSSIARTTNRQYSRTDGKRQGITAPGRETGSRVDFRGNSGAKFNELVWQREIIRHGSSVIT